MSEKLCLQWNDFKDNVISAYENIRENNDFADVTLACGDGEQLEAHRVILAASSPVFQHILKRNLNHSHPLIYMRGVKSVDLMAIVDFLYSGETRIFQENFDSFLAIAEELELKGLVGQRNEELVQRMLVKRKPDDVSKKTKDIFEQNRPSDESIIEHDNAVPSGTVALESQSFKDLEDLHKKTTSMMEKTLTRNAKGKPLFACKLCGKGSANTTEIRRHIEGNHLEGVSLPCKICGKIFKMSNSLSVHIHREHRGCKNNI